VGFAADGVAAAGAGVGAAAGSEVTSGVVGQLGAACTASAAGTLAASAGTAPPGTYVTPPAFAPPSPLAPHAVTHSAAPSQTQIVQTLDMVASGAAANSNTPASLTPWIDA
jgi:hypothetical protein